ncbi:polynucleotide adenylyltransferase [Halomonas sp. V046]|uniref:polynucleotide adenylyltransferase n=1 Tax=Halomonas sp. V046 TaxID=3459611 RepID=UPI0040444CA5
MSEQQDACAGLEVYRVGGAVRDARLGWPVKDTDWVVVGATAEDMRRRGFRPVGRDFPVFLHPESHEEYALARTERKSGHGYTGFVVHASPDVTLEEDLERRDLTINAMAESTDGRLCDPFGGLADLQARRLRHVSSAFVEDPLRVLRTARFLARYHELGFTIAEETWALMAELAASGELAHLVAERVWTETEKALGEPSPAVYFQALEACGALRVLMPELSSGQREASVDDASAPRAACGALTRMTQLPEAMAPSPRWRWGRLVEALGGEARAALAERLKLPKRYRESGEQLARTRELRLVVQGEGDRGTDRGTDREVAALMAWFEAIDGWRRGERVAPLVAILHQDSPSLADDADRAFKAALGVEPRDLVGEGFQGGALGRELSRRRYRAIETALA